MAKKRFIGTIMENFLMKILENKSKFCYSLISKLFLLSLSPGADLGNFLGGGLIFLGSSKMTQYAHGAREIFHLLQGMNFLCRLPFWQRHIVLPVSQKTCHHQKFVF